jgi:hypothetical protein
MSASATGKTNSPIALDTYPSSESIKLDTQRSNRGRAIKHLDRMHRAIRVFAVISIILLVVTIVLLGLAQAEYVHPLLALYTFSGCIVSFIVIKAIDCCQQAVATKHNLDLQEDYYRVRQPAKKKGT